MLEELIGKQVRIRFADFAIPVGPGTYSYTGTLLGIDNEFCKIETKKEIALVNIKYIASIEQ